MLQTQNCQDILKVIKLNEIIYCLLYGSVSKKKPKRCNEATKNVKLMNRTSKWYVFFEKVTLHDMNVSISAWGTHYTLHRKCKLNCKLGYLQNVQTISVFHGIPCASYKLPSKNSNCVTWKSVLCPHEFKRPFFFTSTAKSVEVSYFVEQYYRLLKIWNIVTLKSNSTITVEKLLVTNMVSTFHVPKENKVLVSCPQIVPGPLT